jgi:hypothetical protein
MVVEHLQHVSTISCTVDPNVSHFFFLGLIVTTAFVFQETQLAPHVRNIQDLLCDASMRFSPPQSTWVQPFAFERKKKTVV